MKRRAFARLAHSCLCLCVASFASRALSQDGASAAPSQPSTPAVITIEPQRAAAPGASADPNVDYGASVLNGLRQAVLRDFEGALTTLREAALREPARAEAFCALGDVQLAKGELGEAKAAFETCSRFALSSGDPRLIALGLVGEARVFEREGKRRDEREAWKRVETAAMLDNAKALAAARIAVLDAMLALEADYEGVRTRIAQRKASTEKKAP